jgi:Uma2 family endonuclease
MAVSVPRRLFTVHEYYEMARVGILKPSERVELLDGEIVPMSAVGSPHAWCVKRLTRAFYRFEDRVLVSVQDPLRLNDRSEPEPDLVILQPDTPQDRHPGPADAFLVIEVAETSLRTDRGRKRTMYARAGIPEYWIVDLLHDRIEVYRDPARGRYQSVWLAGRGDTVSPLFAPDLAVDVATILGQPPAEPQAPSDTDTGAR